MRYSENEIERFLVKIDETFPTHISEKVNLHEYAKKLSEKATLCCIDDGNEICSMVAGYTENTIGNIAYISLVATRPELQRRSYATKLLKEFMDICRIKGLNGIHLYTDIKNTGANKLYQKLGYKQWFMKDEPRKKDIHYIYRISENRIV